MRRNRQRDFYATWLLTLVGTALLLCILPPVAAARRDPAPVTLAGMMGGGMGMGPAQTGQTAPSASSAQAGRDLVRYIRDQGLSCLRCHAVDARRFGPSFRAIARSAPGGSDAQGRLRDAIVNGAGRMPAGLADPQQAGQLARYILKLVGHTHAGTQQ